MAGGAVLAQVPPTPGSVLEQLPSGRPAIPASPPEVVLPQQPGPAPGDRNGPRFQVHAFVFTGNTAFPADRLRLVVERFLDLELNLYDLNTAADAVTEFYHDQGYTLARALIPAQRVEDGRVEIAIVEGRVGTVVFSGARRYREDFLAPRVSTLTPGTLVTTDRLERDLLLLNDLPGLKARATMLPGQEFGASDVQIKLDEKPFAANFTLDNYGRKETGEYRLDAGIEVNNPLRFGDQLTLRGIVTDGRQMRYGRLGYSVPLGRDGARLAAGYSKVSYAVGGDFAVLDLDGSAETRELTFQQPLLRSRGRNRYVTLGVRDTRLIQRAFGTEISNIHFSALSAGFALNQINEDASVSNLSFTTASNFRENNTGLSQTSELGRFELDGNHQQPLGNGWDVFLRLDGVYSKDRLPDSEKFSIGGPGSVRGYRSSELRGDTGYQGTLEFRRLTAAASRPLLLSLFYDAGTVIFKQPGFSNDRRSIASYGVGAQIFPFRDTQLKLEYAVPSSSIRATDGERNRLWITMSASF